MSFAIITDSTSDISPARAQELGIYVIPLHVIIEGEDLLDQVQITAQEYVARMASAYSTSRPSAAEPVRESMQRTSSSWVSATWHALA